MAMVCPGMSNYTASVRSVLRKLERAKQRMCNLPVEPKSVQEFKALFPKFLSKTSDGGKFLRFAKQIGDNPADGFF